MQSFAHNALPDLLCMSKDIPLLLYPLTASLLAAGDALEGNIAAKKTTLESTHHFSSRPPVGPPFPNLAVGAGRAQDMGANLNLVSLPFSKQYFFAHQAGKRHAAFRKDQPGL